MVHEGLLLPGWRLHIYSSGPAGFFFAGTEAVGNTWEPTLAYGQSWTGGEVSMTIHTPLGPAT